MTEGIMVPEGIPTSSAYIVQYEENLWFNLPESTQQFCQDMWIKWANPLGLDEVVLRLIPDPIFPQFGKEKPYIHWRHKFPKVPEGEWTEKVTVVINTNDNSDRLERDGQIRLHRYFGKYPKGTRFCVNNLQGRPLWEHTT